MRAFLTQPQCQTRPRLETGDSFYLKLGGGAIQIDKQEGAEIFSPNKLNTL
jgi:hypothetical protein